MTNYNLKPLSQESLADFNDRMNIPRGMRIRKYIVGENTMLYLVFPPSRVVQQLEIDLPSDAIVRRVYHDPSVPGFVFIVESETFDLVPEGQEAPYSVQASIRSYKLTEWGIPTEFPDSVLKRTTMQ